MSIADKLAIIAENEQKVYEAGKQAEWNVFWDSFQQNGTRTNYEGAFDGKGWDDNNFKPKYDIINIGDYSCSQSFRQSKITDLKGILEKQKVEYNTKGATRFINTFQACDVTRIPTLYLDSCGLLQNCFTAGTISEMELHNLQSGCTFVNAFTGARSLSTLTLKNCTIGQNGLNLKDSTKLSRASIESVIHALTDDGEHLDTISNPTVTLSKTAVENAFTKVDCLANATFSDSISEYGLTITNNGDGSFTVNGTYTNGEYCFYAAAITNVPAGVGVYSLFADGAQDIFATGSAGEIIYIGSNFQSIGGEYVIKLVFVGGKTYNNVIVKPQFVYDEWETLIYEKSQRWTIALI